MPLKRKKLNSILLIISLIMIVWAACLYRRLPILHSSAAAEAAAAVSVPDTACAAPPAESPATASAPDTAPPVRATSEKELPARKVSTRFADSDPQKLAAADNPFRLEAAKLLSGRLEETDSTSRHKILSYCEHLRTAYTTRDIDFIRQVFSDNALIIVGHVVTTSDGPGAATSDNGKVVYSIRSKREYVERLSKIFQSGKAVDVGFSEFKIMRHPTMEGIYGVTLRQKYTSGSYADEGYLFLLWDFRNKSMPLIHVRTWQAAAGTGSDPDDIIGIGDFNLE